MASIYHHEDDYPHRRFAITMYCGKLRVTISKAPVRTHG